MNTVKRGFEINSDPTYCSLVLVNRGVIVRGDGSSAEVEVQLYGPAILLSCVLDGGAAFTCKQNAEPVFGRVCDYTTSRSYSHLYYTFA